jgi:septum formation topological specificity factor MinE
MATSNPNYKTDSTMDFFNFMREYYSEQSTEKSLKVIDRRLTTNESSISELKDDVSVIKKYVKIIKDTIMDGFSTTQPPVPDLNKKTKSTTPPRTGQTKPPPLGQSRIPTTLPRPSVGVGGAVTATLAATAAAIPFVQSMISPRKTAEPKTELARISAPDVDTDDYATAVRKASEQTGVPTQLLATIGEIESGSGASMKNPVSSATGAFQFIDSTWAEMMKRFGGEKGYDVSKMSIQDIMKNKELMDLRYNNEMSAFMGAKYLQMNAKALKIDPTDPSAAGKLYLAHFLGGAGAKQVLAGQDLDEEYMKRVIRQNRFMFEGQINLNNPDPIRFREIVTGFAESKVNTAASSKNVANVLETKPSPDLSQKTDAETGDLLSPLTERPGSYTRGSESGTGKREPSFQKSEAGTGRRENIVSIGPKEQRLDPNRQNIFGQRLIEPKLDIVEETLKKSADVISLEEFKKNKEQQSRGKSPVSVLSPDKEGQLPKLTVDRDDKPPISKQEELLNSSALKALGVAGRVSGALTAAEIFSEVADKYVDRSVDASVEQNIRQMGRQIPGPEGGIAYDMTPDQMEEYAARRTNELTKKALDDSNKSAQTNAQNANKALKEFSVNLDTGVVVMQPIVMPEKVIERNTPVPASTAEPGVPPVLPPPSSVDNFNFGYAAP